MEILILFWFVLSVLVGVYASKKGLSGFGHFFVSLLISPLIVFLIAMVSKPDREAIASKSGLKKCLKCAEYVQGEAAVCRYCGNNFKPPVERGGIVLEE
jgi:hypothetical protein